MMEAAATTKRKGLRTMMLEPGIEVIRKWYAEMGNKEIKELEAKYRYRRKVGAGLKPVPPTKQ